MRASVLIPLVVAIASVAAIASGTLAPKVRAVPSGIFVLSARADPPTLHTRCPEGLCAYLELEDFDCPEEPPPPAEVLIIGGHSVPPEYLRAPPEAIARVVQCLRPRLLVLDTCYGFSSPLLELLVTARPAMRVIGATFKLPPQGLAYDDAFYTALPPEERARHVRTRSGARLESWWTDPEELRAALDDVASWDVPRLTAGLQRKHPNLVRVSLHGDEATLLVPVPPSRFRP
ncbi:hypothetical protein VZQ01_37235 [Myxococcus faecalis]|uniref:hypothetical protein n=1 Tax=Myxococcus faecalis TaxID=3115646 RepID=UPI003CECA557